MKPFGRALFLLISTLGLSWVSEAETVYFLLADPLGTVVHKDSYILPLSKEQDINHARYLISRYGFGYSGDDQTIVVANVVGAKDDINRNFLDPKFPKWSWQVSEFRGFADYTSEIWDGTPNGAWPLKTNHWTLPLTNIPASFYRVKVEQANP